MGYRNMGKILSIGKIAMKLTTPAKIKTTLRIIYKLHVLA
jgi:hypothetical protein